MPQSLSFSCKRWKGALLPQRTAGRAGGHSILYWSLGGSFVYSLGYNLSHSDYDWIIMLQKCGGIGSYRFHIKWMIGTHGNWKNQNPGGRFGAIS